MIILLANYSQGIEQGKIEFRRIRSLRMVAVMKTVDVESVHPEFNSTVADKLTGRELSFSGSESFTPKDSPQNENFSTLIRG